VALTLFEFYDLRARGLRPCSIIPVLLLAVNDSRIRIIESLLQREKRPTPIRYMRYGVSDVTTTTTLIERIYYFL